ncbi:MAG: hypothetical protein U0271_16255 [Polyangiaceae bacterium]
MPLKDDVLAALSNDHVRHLRFSVGDFQVTPDLFHEVAEAIEDDYLAIASVDTYTSGSESDAGVDPGTAAFYVTEHDTMFVRPRPAGSQLRQAWDMTAIHETFHAACDLHQMRHMVRLCEEAIAYLVGSAFLRMVAGGTAVHFGESVFQEAHRLVEEHGLADWDSGDPVPALAWTDIDELKRLIHADQHYSMFSETDEVTHHDGIWRTNWLRNRVLFVP